MNDLSNRSIALISTTVAVPQVSKAPAFLRPSAAQIANLTLSEAIPVWAKIRRQRTRLKERTHETTTRYFIALEKFFGPVRLKKITADQLREYQIARESNCRKIDGIISRPWKRIAGNSTINHELCALGTLLNYCGRWNRLKKDYEARGVPAWSPRNILTKEEEARLFECAVGHPEAELAYLVACITNHTSASGCEIRGLRIRNLIWREPKLDEDGNDQNPSIIHIPPEIAKNRNRDREIPLNAMAIRAFRKVEKRAFACGSREPDHYLFPFRVAPYRWDPTRPATRTFLRKSWAKLIELAKTPNLRPHDLRHLFITRSIEAGVSSENLRAVCGHINPRMTEYYSHQRIQAKLDVVNGVSAFQSAQNCRNTMKPPEKKRRNRTPGNQDQMFSLIAAMMEKTERYTEAIEKLAGSIALRPHAD